MKRRHCLARWVCLARYAWAAPASVMGLMLALPVLALGASAQRVEGALEISGGHLARWLLRHPSSCQFGGITLGHVILGICPVTLAALRPHEQVHVHQYEQWGALFLLAYPACSLWALLRGRDPYWDNWFEQQAYRAGHRTAPNT